MVSAEEAARARLAQQVLLARKDPKEYIKLVARADGGLPVKLGQYHEEWQDLMSENDRLIIFAAVGSGKALACDVPIPTPFGWSTMGELREGDYVFDQDGNPSEVVWCSPIMNDRPCYRVIFADGVEVVADQDHQWSVYESQVSKNKRKFVVKTTLELAKDLCKKQNTAPKWRIPVAKAAQYAEKKLPIDPYVLGCWLGDGTSSNSEITCHEDDSFIVDRCEELIDRPKFTRKYKNGTKTFSVVLGGYQGAGDKDYLKLKLKELGVLNNKHIPEIYLQASESQRRQLLAGLLDTDGTVDKNVPRIEYCTVVEKLAKGAMELIRSLGYSATFKCNKSYLCSVRKQDRYRISWSTKDKLFELPRKIDRHSKTSGAYAVDGISIVAIEPCSSVPVKCIGVASKHQTFLFGKSYSVTHNSSQIRWRLEWELGNNPNLRIGLVSSSQASMPAKILSGIRATIESNRALRYVFPHLKPSLKQRKWGDSAIIVDREDDSLDPSLQIFGTGGKILGSRLDLIIVDDLCNHDNTRTEILRDKMYEFVTGPMLSRFSGKGGRVWFIGNTWHRQDVLHKLADTGEYTVKKYSAFKPKLNRLGDPIEGQEEPAIPELWTIEGLRQREKALGIRSKPLLRCELLSDEETRIKREWVMKCLERGRGLTMPSSWNPNDAPTFTGVDLGVGNDPKRGDLTSIFTIALMPDGARRVLDIRSGRWTGPKTLEEIVRVHKAYGSIVYVESNAQQGFLHQFATTLTVAPIKAHKTGLNKYDFSFGVESVGIEFANAGWIIPSIVDPLGMVLPATEEIKNWLIECESYTPTEHAGDRLIASWIAREAARKFDHQYSPIDELYENLDTLAR